MFIHRARGQPVSIPNRPCGEKWYNARLCIVLLKYPLCSYLAVQSTHRLRSHICNLPARSLDKEHDNPQDNPTDKTAGTSNHSDVVITLTKINSEDTPAMEHSLTHTTEECLKSLWTPCNGGPAGPIIQTNINHSVGAQDLLFQAIAAWQVKLAIITEPYRVLIRYLTNTVAIVRRDVPSPVIRVCKRGCGFVVAKWGNLGVVGLYAPPNWPLVTFKRALYQPGELSLLPLREYLLGDFNAKAILWSAS